MSDARYDAVVLGGGHHGTIIAPYLARAGMSVLVLERTAHLGGGACASEGPAPGFVMNHCSHWTRFYGHPAYRDFGLYDEGLRYVFPEENEGMIFDDGSSFIGFSASRVVDATTGRQERSDHNIERTREQIARFSRPDADTYLRLLDAYEQHWKQAFRRHRFSTPPPWGTPDPLEALLDVPGSRIEPVHQFMTLRQLAQDFFESPELQILFMRAATTSTGCFPDDVPGLQGLIHCLPLTLSFEPAAIAIGGSQAITDALVSAGRKLGVEYETSSEVDRIIVEHGRATGIELAGRRPDRRRPRRQRPRARPDRAPPAQRRRARGPPAPPDRQHPLRPGPAPVGQPRAPRAAPLHSLSATTRASARSRGCTGDRKDLDYLHLRYQPEILTRGFATRPYVLCSVDSLWDPTRAPDGSISSASRSSPRHGAASPTISGGRSRTASPTTCCANGQVTRRT